MRKKVTVLTFGLLFVLLTACTIKQDVNLNYGDVYTVENEKLAKYESLEWEVFDKNVACVEDGVITAVGPGTTVVTARVEDKTVAEFLCNVTTIPVESILLSPSGCELEVDSSIQLVYTLYPENASDYALSWKTSNAEIANVDENGLVTAVEPGQATVSLSNQEGVVAVCNVTVLQKPAYERLSDDEREFVDLALKYLSVFKNPDSVIIKAVSRGYGNTWLVEVSAQNGFGGNSTEIYQLDDSFGFWNWDSFDVDLELKMTPDDSFDVALINDAIEEKR